MAEDFPMDSEQYDTVDEAESQDSVAEDADDGDVVVEEVDVVEVDDDPLAEQIAAMKERLESDPTPTNADLDLIADIGVDFLRQILICFGEEGCSIDEYDGDEGELILDISGGTPAMLIGHHGRTLEALQSVFTAMMGRRLGFFYPVQVDVEGYKARRRRKVIESARHAARKARQTGGEVRMNPMSAYERRLVHLTLRDYDDVITHSEGDDPYRYVVVTTVRDGE